MMIETAQIMNLDSGTVSKRKRRLKETLKNDKGLRLLLVSKERLAKSKELSPERVVLIHNLLPQAQRSSNPARRDAPQGPKGRSSNGVLSQRSDRLGQGVKQLYDLASLFTDS